jgi:hypothetical protein
VRFYDCQQADKDRDYSGTNPKYYPIGKVIRSATTDECYIIEYCTTLNDTDIAGQIYTDCIECISDGGKECKP